MSKVFNLLKFISKKKNFKFKIQLLTLGKIDQIKSSNIFRHIKMALGSNF